MRTVLGVGVLCFGLLWAGGLAAPPGWAEEEPADAAADRPPPATVAAWLLYGDEGSRDRAVLLLQTGDREFARYVVDALRRHRRGDRSLHIDRWIDRALEARGPDRVAAIRRLLAFGEDGIRALLARLPGRTNVPSTPTVDVQALAPPGGEREERLVAIEMRVLAVGRERLRQLFGERLLATRPPSIVLRAADVLALLGSDGDGGMGVQVLSAPRLVAHAGQRASVSLVNEVSYLKDYEVQVAADGSRVADPVVGTIEEGLLLDVTPERAEGGGGITLQLAATWAEIHRPIPEVETSIAGHDEKVKIQLPEVEVRKVNLAAAAPPGTWRLLGGLGEDEGGVRLLLVRATLLDPDEIDTYDVEFPGGEITPR